MRARFSPLQHFELGVSQVLRLYNVSESLRPDSRHSSRPISHRQADDIVALAFMKAFTVWEVFLEEAFVAYLVGARGLTGRERKRYFFPEGPSQARRFLRGDRNICDWSDVSVVTQRAVMHFRRGEPFRSALEARKMRLGQAKRVRNAIAHSSQDAWEKFRQVVRDEIAYVPYAISPGGFLCTDVIGEPTHAYIEEFLDAFRSAASEISQ
jgi:hypothetical protein